MPAKPISNAMDSASARFWRRYVALLKRQHIPSSSFPWYRRHVEAYISAADGKPLRTHNETDVERYLERLGRDASLRDWQFAQHVQALRVLFGDLLRRDWAENFDWRFWEDGAKRLGRAHATLAREQGALPLPEERRNGSRLQAAFQSRCPTLHHALISAIRVRGYSIRTEQTYIDWIARFLAFHDWRPANSLSGNEVTAFLTHLFGEAQRIGDRVQY